VIGSQAAPARSRWYGGLDRVCGGAVRRPRGRVGPLHTAPVRALTLRHAWSGRPNTQARGRHATCRDSAVGAWPAPTVPTRGRADPGGNRLGSGVGSAGDRRGPGRGTGGSGYGGGTGGSTGGNGSGGFGHGGRGSDRPAPGHQSGEERAFSQLGDLNMVDTRVQAAYEGRQQVVGEWPMRWLTAQAQHDGKRFVPAHEDG
jgi:hypothetical protein